MVKNIFNTVKDFRASSVFHGKRKLLKNPERWKKFQCSVYSLEGDDPFECASLCALVKRTAMITQTGVWKQTLRSGAVAFSHCVASSKSCTYICISKGNYRRVSCLGEHNTQGTLPPWVNKQGNYTICL